MLSATFIVKQLRVTLWWRKAMPFAILVRMIHIYSVHYLCNNMMKKGNVFRNISCYSVHYIASRAFFHLHFSVTVDHILQQQRTLLSDWSVQSAISLVNPLKSCQFIQSKGRRLPRIDGCICSVIFPRFEWIDKKFQWINQWNSRLDWPIGQKSPLFPPPGFGASLC